MLASPTQVTSFTLELIVPGSQSLLNMSSCVLWLHRYSLCSLGVHSPVNPNPQHSREDMLNIELGLS